MPADAPDGQDPQPVAVLSYKFWQRHYRGDPTIVGKTIQLNHKTYAILGVMPVRFTWRDGDVYVPLKMESDQTHRYSPEFKVRPGVTFDAAADEFLPLFQQFDKQTPNLFPKQFKISVRGLADTYTRDLKKTMYLLFGAVALLLAIGCGNVSILLLARSTARQHEFAIRSAVGASQIRLVRQLLTESLLLSGIGAGLGVLVACQAIKFIIPKEFRSLVSLRSRLPHQPACFVFQRGPRAPQRDCVRTLSCAAIVATRDQPGDAGGHSPTHW